MFVQRLPNVFPTPWTLGTRWVVVVQMSLVHWAVGINRLHVIHPDITPVVGIMLTWLLALGTIRYDKFELHPDITRCETIKSKHNMHGCIACI